MAVGLVDCSSDTVLINWIILGSRSDNAILNKEYIMIHHWKCKLTEDTVEEIYIELREGTHCQDIADMFGISRGLVDHVNHGRSWPVTGMSYPIRKRNKKVKPLGYDEFPIEDRYEVSYTTL